MTNTLLSTKNITKQFDGVRAVDGVSVAFEAGKITSLIGPNGSGKSTLINLLSGYMPMTEGSVLFGGAYEKSKIRPWNVAAYGVTRTFQHVGLFEQMTVMDNLLVVLTERNVFKALFEQHEEYHEEKAKEVLQKIDLWEKRNELAVNLSYGQRKLIEIGRVLAMDMRTDGRTEVVFFDEPYAGLFPEMRKTVSNILRELRDENKAVVLVEHSMDIIRALSDWVYVMDAGKLLADGKPEEVLEKREVIEAYLGD